MPLLLKNIWIIPLLIVVLFRDTIFGLGNDDGKPTWEPKPDTHVNIDETQAQILADRLHQAMNKAGWTSLDDIWAVFEELKTRKDFNTVYNAFGLRLYNDVFGRTGIPVLDPEVDLITWLESELSQNEKEKLAKDFPIIKWI